MTPNGFHAALTVPIWAAPLAGALLLSLWGDRMPRRLLALLSFGGALLPCIFGAFLLWTRFSNASAITPDGTALGASLLSCFLSLCALWQAQRSVAHLSLRHRFYALMLLLLACANFLFMRPAIDLGFLLGWEGLSLAGSFLAGFWAVEERGGRTGVRWLILNRASGLLLFLAMITAGSPAAEAPAALLLGAALMRAGAFPFHGTVSEMGRSRPTAALLVQTVASWIPAVFLLDRLQDALDHHPALLDLLLWLALASAAFSLLAALQPQAPQKATGWLNTTASSLALLGFASGDPVAALTLCAGAALLGASRFMLLPPEPDAGPDEGPPVPALRLRAGSLVASLIAIVPPALWFAGSARLLAAAAQDERGSFIIAAVFAVQFGLGAALRRLHWYLPPEVERDRRWPWPALACAAGNLLAGSVGLALFSQTLWGGAPGARLGLGAVLACGAGWLLAGAMARRLAPMRLSSFRRFLELMADTGLGIGRLVLLVPAGLARAAGVILSRLLGDILVDGLATGLPVRTIEGTGLALRQVHDGRIRRTLLFAIWTALILLWAWTRG